MAMAPSTETPPQRSHPVHDLPPITAARLQQGMSLSALARAAQIDPGPPRADGAALPLRLAHPRRARASRSDSRADRRRDSLSAVTGDADRRPTTAAEPFKRSASAPAADPRQRSAATRSAHHTGGTRPGACHPCPPPAFRGAILTRLRLQYFCLRGFSSIGVVRRSVVAPPPTGWLALEPTHPDQQSDEHCDVAVKIEISVGQQNQHAADQ